jgi:hypothetical protein
MVPEPVYQKFEEEFSIADFPFAALPAHAGNIIDEAFVFLNVWVAMPPVQTIPGHQILFISKMFLCIIDQFLEQTLDMFIG